jgi:hypothetical protein
MAFDYDKWEADLDQEKLQLHPQLSQKERQRRIQELILEREQDMQRVLEHERKVQEREGKEYHAKEQIRKSKEEGYQNPCDCADGVCGDDGWCPVHSTCLSAKPRSYAQSKTFAEWWAGTRYKKCATASDGTPTTTTTADEKEGGGRHHHHHHHSHYALLPQSMHHHHRRLGGARTKQTARKTTGGKPPRKRSRSRSRSRSPSPVRKVRQHDLVKEMIKEMDRFLKRVSLDDVTFRNVKHQFSILFGRAVVERHKDFLRTLARDRVHFFLGKAKHAKHPKHGGGTRQQKVASSSPVTTVRRSTRLKQQKQG